MNKNKRKNLTNHSIRRAKQRTGMGKSQLTSVAGRARAIGLHQGNTRGDLQEEILSHSTRAVNVRFYANAIYIYKGPILITVINVDPKYEKNLLDYVNIPTYVIYKENRAKKKSNFSSLSRAARNAAKARAKAEIEKYGKGMFVFQSLNITGEKTSTVHVRMPRLSPEYKEQIKDFKEFTKKTLGLNAVVDNITEENNMIEKLNFNYSNHKCSRAVFFFKIASYALDPESFERVSDQLYKNDVVSCLKVCDVAYMKYLLSEIKKGTISNAKYLAMLEILQKSYAQKKHHDLLSYFMYEGIYYSATGGRELVRGFIINGTDLISNDGVRYKNVQNINRIGAVALYGTARRVAHHVKETTPDKFVDLWGQVQWQKDLG